MTDGMAVETLDGVEQPAAPCDRWKPYPAYKDSGVEWLGEIPSGWDVRRLKYVANCQVSNVDKKKSDDEKPVRLCNYTDVYYNERITDDLELMEATATPEEVAKFSLRKDDVLITKDSEDWRDIGVPAWVPSGIVGVLCGYHLAHLRPQPTRIHAEYLFRCLQASAVNYQLQIAATGITRYGLPNRAIRDAIIPLPPLEEQLSIVIFLDCETRRVDALVPNAFDGNSLRRDSAEGPISKSIRLLREYRAKIILAAVTGQINVREGAG